MKKAHGYPEVLLRFTKKGRRTSTHTIMGIWVSTGKISRTCHSIISRYPDTQNSRILLQEEIEVMPTNVQGRGKKAGHINGLM